MKPDKITVQLLQLLSDTY